VRHTPHGLSRHLQCLTACGNDPQSQRRTQHRLRDIGAGINQMLAVVENQKKITVTHVIEQHVPRGALGTFSNAGGVQLESAETVRDVSGRRAHGSPILP
jgi:hypothetical protein